MQNLTYGVDISHYQDSIDWNQALAMGKRFCSAKASDGLSSNADSMFEIHRHESKSAGLIFGAYHFLRFDPPWKPQMDTFLKVTGGVLPGELPLCLDVEWDNQSRNVKYHDGGNMDETAASIALACLGYLEQQTGMTPIIYTSNGFLNGFSSPECFSRFIPWIASYTTIDNIVVPKPWSATRFWQYNDNLTIGGVQQIDSDAFFGTFEELKALTKSEAPATPANTKISADKWKALQHATNDMGFTPPLVEDGIPGPLTRARLVEVSKA